MFIRPLKVARTTLMELLEPMLLAVATSFASRRGVQQPQRSIVANIPFRQPFAGLSAGRMNVMLLTPFVDLTGQLFR